MFNTTDPGTDAIRYSGEGDFSSFNDDEIFVNSEEEDFDDFDRYEDEYGDLNDEWLDDNHEYNMRAKFSRSARNGGDW